MAFLLVVVGALGSPSRLSRLLASVAHRPARLMASTFGLAALVGALLLALPVSLRHVEDASLVDALFNSMSAVCVTGLAVNNVAEAYTPFGQLVIVVLIQVGGLGIMVLFGFFSVLSGQQLRAKHAAAMAELLDVRSFVEMRRMLLRIVVFTFAVEAVGTILLFVGFAGHPEIGFSAVDSAEPLAGSGSLLWAAVFHSVSAFCNAGFSTFRDGALPFGNETFVPLVLGVLIVLGGIGFPVAIEVASHVRARLERERHVRLTLHSRVVLWTTAALVVGGSVMFWLLESRGAMSHLGWGHRLIASWFQSVTCRTAGFSTIDFSIVSPAALLFGCALMMVGASPGSTGGGIKTTTLATLLAVLRSELRQANPELSGRRISLETVRRAVAVVMVSVLVVGVALFLLLLVEDMEPMKLAFEAISAYTTTGLSTGITPDLSHVGKMLLTLTMFAGRIGPLTLALAVSQRAGSSRLGLVEERIAIG
jgi:trk system potassium uptake protein TrkH